MKIVYELINHWIQYGRPGGTPFDFDVFRGSDVIGQFESREAAEREIEVLKIKAEKRILSTHIEEEYDEYEIKEVNVPEVP
ncbi:MAG: hypothetical protein JWM11_3723 [Planctomycetaceae bacterium]|nr:hypothetical protein [Planctomycetaceae bacterium]